MKLKLEDYMETFEKVKIIEKKHLYTSDEKLKHLGYGEWVEELDEVNFEYLGFICLIIRIFKQEFGSDRYFGGHFCGYVDIPKSHPYYIKHFSDIHIDCHGSLTYSQYHDEFWRIGFDCGHSIDFIPSLEFFRKNSVETQELRKKFPLPSGFKKHPLFNPVYRNIKFCINECCSIVDQLLKV